MSAFEEFQRFQASQALIAFLPPPLIITFLSLDLVRIGTVSRAIA